MTKKYSLLLAILLFPAGASPALAMRCGVSLVTEGQSKYDVLQRCGEPAYTNSRVEYRRVLPNALTPVPLDSESLSYPYPAVREVVFEEWVYNFGSTQLMQSLLFEDGRLLKIRSLGYGR